MNILNIDAGLDIHGPKIGVQSLDIHRATIDAEIELPGVDIHGPKFDAGIDIHGPKIGVPTLDIHRPKKLMQDLVYLVLIFMDQKLMQELEYLMLIFMDQNLMKH